MNAAILLATGQSQTSWPDALVLIAMFALIGFVLWAFLR